MSGEFIFLVSIIFLAALTNSTFGFGFNLVAMSLLTLYFDISFIAPLIPLLFLSTTLLIVIRSRKEIKYKSIIQIMIGASVAVPIGIAVAKYGNAQVVKITIGSIIVALALFNLFAPKMPHLKDNRYASLFGFVSGLFGGAYNITGPPVVIYGLFRQWDPQAFRATMQGYFTYVTMLIILTHWYAGNFNNEKIGYFYLGALPAVLIATPIGKYINQKFDNPEAFRKYVYYIMLVLGIVMIAKATVFILSN